MSVSNIQKVNQLAQEFMKHGIVANSQEAYAKAEAALAANASSSGDSSSGAAPSIEESETIMQIRRDIMMMQKAISDLEKQVQYLTNKESSMAAEILALKTRPPQVIVEQKRAEVQTTIGGEPSKQQAQQPQQQSNPIRSRAATQTIKGSTFTEDDIAIDKVFYFGQKK
jgi:hypothetical protein